MDPSRALKLYIGYLRLQRGLAENTLVSYATDLGHYINYLEQLGKTPAEAEPMDVHGFLAALGELGISARSIARAVAALRSFHQFLLSEGYAATDPTELVESPRIPQHLPDTLSVAEIDAMVEAIDPARAHALRNRAIVETLYGSGLRVSELTSLRLSRVDLERGFLVVVGKGDKERLVPISPVAARYIGLYLEERAGMTPARGAEDTLFLNARGAALSRQMVFLIIKELATLAGIGKSVSPHTLRHSFASHLLEGGANLRAIQEMMGHATIRATQVYLHLETAKLRQELLLHHPHYQKRGEP